MRLGRIPAEQMAVFLNHFGNRSSAEYQHPVALMYFEEPLEIYHTSVAVNISLVVKTHGHMVTALEAFERLEEAIYSTIQVSETTFPASGPDHPDAQAYQNHVDKLLRKLPFL